MVAPEAWARAFEQGALGTALTYLDLSECSRLDDRALRAAARAVPHLGNMGLRAGWTRP